MPHDFNKPSHVQTPEERQKKKRVPLYILALVGIFLIALLFYNIGIGRNFLNRIIILYVCRYQAKSE